MTLLLTRRDVADLLPIEACIDAVEGAFRLHGEGRAEPPGILGMHAREGSFHVKAGFLDLGRRYFAAKTNANFPGNPGRFGLPTIQGVVLLADADQGTGDQGTGDQGAGDTELRRITHRAIDEATHERIREAFPDHAIVAEAVALCPISRLFAGAAITVDAILDDNGGVVVTVTHIPTQLAATESAPTRKPALRKAQNRLAAMVAELPDHPEQDVA